jgi:hypothetical protein
MNALRQRLTMCELAIGLDWVKSYRRLLDGFRSEPAVGPGTFEQL